MSKKPEKASVPERAERDTASVYDFLYHDARRVGSFLSQFHASGLLQSVKETEALGENTATKSGASAGGGLPGIARGQAQFEDQAGSERREASERTYDPLWQNARALLDFLDERDMIRRDLQSARIGQFVLVKGRLSVLDTGLMRDAWHLPTISKMIRAGAAQNPKNMKGQPQPVEVIMDLLKVLPHSTHAVLQGAHDSVWFGLDSASLITAASDLLLKHGTEIAGEWHLLGILDARPEPPKGIGWAVSEVSAASTVPEDRIVATLIEALAPIARNMFGRPPASYGATPLLVFRQVEAAG